MVEGFFLFSVNNTYEGGEIIKKFPFIKQSENKNCGATCLLMIINYYKKDYDSGEINKLCNTTINGINAYDLVNAANFLGFDSCAYKCDIEDLKNIILPCIAHVTINNSFLHYVVIYKVDFKRKYIYISDPAIGLRKLSFDEFNNIFNKIIIKVEPTFKVELPHKKNKIFIFLKNVFIYYKKSFIYLILMSLIITVLSICVSYYFQMAFNTLNTTHSTPKLLFLLLLFIIIYLFKNITDLFRNKLFIYIDKMFDYNFTKNVFKKIILLPYKHYRNHQTGNIISRITDLSTIRKLISKIFISIFVDLVLVIISSIFLINISYKLFLISLCLFILYALLYLIFKPQFNSSILNYQQSRSSVISYMFESISSFETIKGLSIEEEKINDFDKKYMESLNDSFKYNNINIVESFVKETIDNIGLCLIIFIGCILVMKNEISFGDLITYNSLLLYFLTPIKNILSISSDISEASSALNRISEVLVNYEENGFVFNEITGNISYKNLSYSYNNKSLILKNINLDISSGSKVMIIGQSGSGKSTLLKLLMKYYEANRGELYLDDIDINDYGAKCIKDNICYVSQNEMLYTDSVYNNIVLNREIDINKFMEIQKMCYIEEILKNNNLGFNMILEENGNNLSGGERQRIIMARSLIKNFKILIIDEGLNQVDKELEHKIISNIFEKYKDKTIIVISHRLENKELFDKVIDLGELNA